jgi:hypothetical protein
VSLARALARNFELLHVGTGHGAPPGERLEFTICLEKLRMRLRGARHRTRLS